MKLLSIVIPTYNMEKYLSRCLLSIISVNEDRDDLEVLVVNDGSKDDGKTKKIAKEYGDKIKYYFQTINDGRYACKSCSSVLPEYIEQDFSMIINMIMSRYEHFGKPKEPNESENQNIAY